MHADGESSWVAHVNFTCTDGYKGRSLSIGYNGTLNNGTDIWCESEWSESESGFYYNASTYQPDSEGIFAFR